MKAAGRPQPRLWYSGALLARLVWSREQSRRTAQVVVVMVHQTAEERLEKDELRLHSLSPIPGTNILSRDSGKKTFCLISSRGKS